MSMKRNPVRDGMCTSVQDGTKSITHVEVYYTAVLVLYV